MVVKMKIYISVILSLVFFASLYSDDLTTNSGRIFKNYSVIEPNMLGLTISHASGVFTVKYNDLPENIRSKYKLDEEKAIAFQKKKEEEKKLIEEAKKAEQEQEKKALEAKKNKEDKEGKNAPAKKQKSIVVTDTMLKKYNI